MIGHALMLLRFLAFGAHRWGYLHSLRDLHVVKDSQGGKGAPSFSFHETATRPYGVGGSDFTCRCSFGRLSRACWSHSAGARSKRIRTDLWIRKIRTGRGVKEANCWSLSSLTFLKVIALGARGETERRSTTPTTNWGSISLHAWSDRVNNLSGPCSFHRCVLPGASLMYLGLV
jgi:hypothetical protein